MDNLLKLLYRQTTNFAIKREIIVPVQFKGDENALIIEVTAVGSNPSKPSFGTVTPLLFIAEAGFVDAQSFQLKFGKNQLRVDTDFVTNFRLRINPYLQSKTNTQIIIYKPLNRPNPSQPFILGL